MPPSILQQGCRELYTLLVEPAQRDIKPGATLIIVPDGLLHRLPFAYLHDGQRYLLERAGLFYTPSLQVLGILRQRERTSAGTGVLAIACAADTGRVHPYSDAVITGLPGAVAEVQRLAQLFDGAVILTGRAANEQKIRSGVLENADIVHFAAHGYADETDLRRSYLVLNRAPETASRALGSRNDGLLQWNEIVNLDLNASLVTLASCRSAGGPLTTGEGITGLTQAFLYAGSRGVLATLTDVPDQNTTRIMDRFYSQLSRGTTAAEALRVAQLEGLDRGPEGAEFVLIGDGALTHTGHRRQGWGTGALLAVGLCLVLGLVRVFNDPRKKV